MTASGSASKQDTGRILDEVVAVTGWSRDYARRRLVAAGTTSPALFAGGDALGQVWLFILAPLVGSLVAVALWKLTRTTDAETEALVAGSERE